MNKRKGNNREIKIHQEKLTNNGFPGLRKLTLAISGLCRQSTCFIFMRACASVCVCVCVKSLQLCPTLCGPRDCSPLGFSVHGISQARILEWVAMLSWRGSSLHRDQSHIFYVSSIGRQVLYH